MKLINSSKVSKKKKSTTTEIMGLVSEVIKETPDTRTLRIKMQNLTNKQKFFSFKPGQFVMVRPEINGRVVPRAYSISSSPTRADNENGYIDLTVRETKDPAVSKWLNKRIIGDKLLFRGPFGRFYWGEYYPECSQLLLIGGGSGITPLKSILEYISDKNLDNKAKLLYSVKTETDIIFKKSLFDLKDKNPEIDISISLTREPERSSWQGKRGRVDKPFIQKQLKELEIVKTGCYLCGTPNFVKSMTELLKESGIDETKIWHEKWQ